MGGATNGTVRQQTLARAVEFSGTGLHTGGRTDVVVRPAPPGTGVVFVRTDLPGKPRIPATAGNRVDQPRRTAIEADGAEVHTIEHLLSAMAGLEIDNAQIEIGGQEVPGLDGSAKNYTELLLSAGFVEQDAPRTEIRLKRPIELEGANGSRIAALPREHGLKISYTLDYPLPLLSNVKFEVDLTRETYARDVAPARTFVMREEAMLLPTMGMGIGATFENTVVFDETVTTDFLRFPDEPARHKVLDFIGDLSLLGARLHAHIVAKKSGHALNLELVNAITAAVIAEAFEA